jgi:hypothetical protein
MEMVDTHQVLIIQLSYRAVHHLSCLLQLNILSPERT